MPDSAGRAQDARQPGSQTLIEMRRAAVAGVCSVVGIAPHPVPGLAEHAAQSLY
ncbi:hypothetical protein [Mycobacterium innocens]|uniref:hypothetical protein n=1 Tax=Mycobacterium innocens TaxID=2341083 RepID=UPI00142DD222|nr:MULTISPECIES: hypothetical protein [Mycobacterium]